MTNAKHSNENYLFCDSALSSLNDLTSLKNIDICLDDNKRILKQPSIQSQSFNRLISSFTTPKQSKIPILLSQSMSESHKSRKYFNSSLVQLSCSSSNEITLGSSEQLSEIYFSPRIEAERLLKTCRGNKKIINTKYSKPSLLTPLKRDLLFYNNDIFSSNNVTNSIYFNEQSSGLGSSIITTQSFIDEGEEKEIKDSVAKYMSFTKMRHSLKIYRNKLGGFDEDYYKKSNWLFLSPRGSCRMCKHIPSFTLNYKKIKKPNVVKRRPCICKKMQVTCDIKNLCTDNNDKNFMLNFETSLLQEYFFILLLPGVIAFFIEALLQIISMF